METQPRESAMKKLGLLISSIILAVGSCGGPLIMRLYFIHGGRSIWLSSFLQTAGFPIILIPFLIDYSRRRDKFIPLKPKLFVAGAVIGLLTGLDDYFYAYGVSKLPVSTSSLIIATQLGFVAVFAFFLVKHKFTAYSINAVVLLTIGAAVLALHASGDKPKGESDKEYMLGFVMTLAAAALYGLILPLMELAYAKSGQTIGFTVVLGFQMVISFFATALCAVGMLANGDFQRMSIEGRVFKLGIAKYYAIVITSALLWQMFFLGITGVIFCSSALFSGVVITFLLPPTEILAVLFFREKFQAEKGVSLVLSLWGFVSYFYGEWLTLRRREKRMSLEMIGGESAVAVPISVPPPP